MKFALILILGLAARPVHARVSLACVSEPACGTHASAEYAAKVNACEIVVATPECQSLKPKHKLRDCKREALCPNQPDQDYVAGCILGGRDFIVDFVKAPIMLLGSAIDRAKFEAKYYNPQLQTACNDAQDAVAAAKPGDDLDCESGFWHAACPRTLMNNCKRRLVEEFPDIQAAYGDKLAQTPYDDILKTVRTRIDHLNSLKPSLLKFIGEHREDPWGAITKLVSGELAKQGYKFSCLNAEDIAEFSCDAIFNVLSVGYGGFKSVVKAGANASKIAFADFAKAESLLGRALRKGEPEAIQTAHEIGIGEIGADGGPASAGNYTFGQKKRKMAALMDAGFTKDEAALLMEKSVVGLKEIEASIANLDYLSSLPQEVRINNGELKVFRNRLQSCGSKCSSVIDDVTKALKAANENIASLEEKLEKKFDDPAQAASHDRILKLIDKLSQCKAVKFKGCGEVLKEAKSEVDPIKKGPDALSTPPPPPPTKLSGTEIYKLTFLSSQQKGELSRILRDTDTDTSVARLAARAAGTDKSIYYTPTKFDESVSAIVGKGATVVNESSKTVIISAAKDIKVVLEPGQRYFTVKIKDPKAKSGWTYLEFEPDANGVLKQVPRARGISDEEWLSRTHFTY